MSIRVKCYLRSAEKSDLFSSNEDMILGNPLFIKSHLTGKFQGPWYSNSSFSFFELVVKETMGMVYILKYRLPLDPSVFGFAIELELCNTTIYDIKENQNQFFENRPYFTKKDTKIEGPFYFNADTDPFEIKKLMDNNQLFSINTNQQIKFLTKQKEVA